ncbi:hypothetical protein ES332_D04G183300v1 [Gossypium tomentosum]|uniref:Uncharacterized protein n=1 Tax=Gossypium tomentosum TaxID=34277 RepID=A0A5D2LF84_GOSTO|nr:hypothetical protein ES332_D04G183300v1 [Gossypium tomentosum]
MMKGKEKVSKEVSTKPSVVSITQSPTLPSLPPRNRSNTISRRFGANESQWDSDEEEDVYGDGNYEEEIHQRTLAMLKRYRWKPFAGA